MLAEEVEEERDRSTAKFCKFRVEKATHPSPFLYEAMATIRMATSTSLGAYFPLIRLAVYPTHPFNGDHSLGSVEFPRRVFHVAWLGSVPKVFKNIGDAPTTMVINYECDSHIRTRHTQLRCCGLRHQDCVQHPRSSGTVHCVAG